MKKYHAPGLGEVHSSDHSTIIFCESNIESETGRTVDDELANKICDLLNGWIKVSDELPPEGEEVLTYSPNLPSTKVVAYTNSCYSTLWCVNGKQIPEYYLPSHWLRLPKLEI